MNELKGKPTNQNHSPNQSMQAKKPVGPDTMYFDALRGRRIRCSFISGADFVFDGVMLDWDKYGIVVEKFGPATGPIYIFKAALSEIFPID